MAIPRTGVLGAAALGSLLLAAPAIRRSGGSRLPRVRSSASGSGPRSSMSKNGVKSAITAATVKGRVE